MLLTAIGLTLALGACHSYLGERYILIRLFRRTDLPRLFGSDVFTRHTLRFAWHLTTVSWYGIAAILLYLVSGAVSRAEAGAVIAVTTFISGVIACVGSRGRHLAWPVFMLIALLVWQGTR